jgi:membrane carboxypeptidase/penicillin-binding protein
MLGLERAHKKYADSWIDSQALGKTGTTNDSRTCWFAGSTPELTTVVYIGCDDNRSMGKNVYPVRTTFPIWLQFHRQVATKKHLFSFDPSLHEYLVDAQTGKIAQACEQGAITIFG